MSAPGTKTAPRGVKEVPRVLLMTDYPPDEPHGGGHLMRRLVGCLPNESVAWFSSRPLRGGKMPPGLEGIPFAHADYTWRRPNRFGLAAWRERFNLQWASQLQARAAAAWGRRHGVKGVWAVMQDQCILSGPAAARRLGVPLHVSVHDDPRYLLLGRLGVGGYKWLRGEFYRIFAKAAGRDVISEAMRRRYLSRTGSDALIITDGIEGIPGLRGEPVAPLRKSGLEILHSGIVYDDGLLLDFITALGELADEGKFPPFRFILCGGDDYKPRWKEWPSRAEWAGWLEPEVLSKRLRGADLLYLQHPFDEERRIFSETSFPTKLLGYLAARRPILLHVPAWSSVAELARRHRLPLCLHEPDGARAARALVAQLPMLDDEAERGGGYVALMQEFDWTEIRSRLVTMIRALVG